MNFYFATVLLEKNRWTAGRIPACRVTHWIDRILSAGFKGIELWENHAYAASRETLAQLRNTVPDIIFNTYADFSNDSKDHLKKASKAILELGASGCKFNFGNDPEKLTEYIGNFRDWSRDFPRGFRFLCECHAGTLLEKPRDARDILSELGHTGIEAIVHAGTPPQEIREWFDALGSRITHCHLNLFRCGSSPWETPGAFDFDFRRSLEIIGSSSVHTTSLEFVRGVGGDREDMDELFARAIDDRDQFKGLLKNLQSRR